MEIQHIRYFLALCEERNFARAARRCGVSQPSLSNAIKRLENRVGGCLFVRSKRPQAETQLTDLALILKPHLEQAMDLIDHALETAWTHSLAKSKSRVFGDAVSRMVDSAERATNFSNDARTQIALSTSRQG